MSPTVAVVTDSAASLPPELARRWGIGVVPLQVIVDGEARAEGDDIGADEVLAALVAGRTVTTSQPSQAAFERAYAEAAAAGATAVVVVTISGALSGTFTVAGTAAKLASVPVVVVDTRTVAMASGYAAIAAAALAATGADAAAVAAEASRVAAGSLCVFTVDTLEFLRRGGRISPAVAAIGTVLGVRPILEMRDGEVVLAERVRTTARARAAVIARVEHAVAAAARPAVALMGLGDGGYAEEAARELAGRHSGLAMLVQTPVSVVLSAHAGPGALAAVVVDLPDRVA